MKQGFLAIMVILMCRSLAPDIRASDPSETSFEEGVSEVVRLLKDSPPWVTESEPEARSFILYRYRKIAEYDTAVIRVGAVRFCDYAERLPSELRALERAKLVLLNRFIFEIPKTVVLTDAEVARVLVARRCEYSGGQVFADEPWVLPNSDVEKRYYVIAPLLETNEGQINIGFGGEVLGRNAWFSCELLLAEFDFFSARFGRRRLDSVQHDDAASR